MSESPEPRRGHFKSPRKRDLKSKTMFKRLEKGVFHWLRDKGKSTSAYSNDSRRQSYHSSRRDRRKRCQKAKVAQEDIGSQGQRGKSRVLRTTCPSHGVPAATVTTTTLSTTFASASSIPPITVDDYEIVHEDGQESPRMFPLRSHSLYAPFPKASVTSYGPSHLGPSFPPSSAWLALLLRSMLISKASLFFIMSTSVVLKVGMPISTRITAFVPYVSENGVSSLLNLIIYSAPVRHVKSLISSFCISRPTVPWPAIKASYSATLLVALNLNLRAYVNFVPSRFVIIRPALEPSMHDDPSVKSIYGSRSSSLSSMGVSGGSSFGRSTMKSAKICPLTNSLKNGNDFLADLDINLLRLASFPFSLCTSFKHFGDGKLKTTSTLSGHTFNPSAFTLYPRNMPSLILKRPPAFLLLRRLPYFSQENISRLHLSSPHSSFRHSSVKAEPIVIACSGYSGWGQEPVIDQVIEEKIQVSTHPEYPEQAITIGSALTEECRKELCGLLRCNLDIFAWKPTDMTGVQRHIAEYRLNIHEGCLLIRQKKRRQAPERNKAIYEEVEKLVDAGIMKKVHYHSWLSNPVQQERLKAVKARLNFEETSKHSESGTSSRRRDLKKRLGSRHACCMSESPEPRRGHSKSPRKRDPKSKTMFKRLEKGVFHWLRDKGKSTSAYSNDSRRQSYHSSHRDSKSCYQSSCSREMEFAFEKHHNKRASSRRTEALSKTEGSAGGHWKSRPKRQKSSVEDDLS
nr:reverse transcriptase domain-containing protein [Tanacetum cinerariifolium]